jgi:TM2 domain-containing membrane protein YozV
MYCSNCANEVSDKALACPSCGFQISTPTDISTKKIIVGITALLWGAMGVHKFILGYKKEGLILLSVSVLSLFMLAIIPAIIGWIEGITYLCKSNEEFERIYIKGKRSWF